MSTVEFEKVKKENDENGLFHLVEPHIFPIPNVALCGAKLKGIDYGITFEPNIDICVLCSDLAGLF